MVSARTARILVLVGFTYDHRRQALILRGIGHRWGPVFRSKDVPR
jgi:hypothetical protein